MTEARGTVEAKNKGQLATFFVNRIKPEFCADTEGPCSRRAVPVAAQRRRLRILAMANDPRGDIVS